MELKDLLNEQYIDCNVVVNTKREAIELVYQKMLAADAVTPEYLDSMIKRDAGVSVAIGNLLAIAHGEDDSKEFIKKNFLCLIVLKKEINWDGNPVKVVLGLALSRDATMDIIGNIGVAFSDLDAVTKVFNDSNINAEKILKFLKEVE